VRSFHPQRMSRIFGANPRPRILLEHIPEHLHRGYRNRFPTVTAVEALREVDQAEFDLLITTRDAVNAADHLRVIVFSEATNFQDVVDLAGSGSGTHFHVQWAGTSRASEFHVPSEWPEDLGRFIQVRLIPLATGKTSNPVLGQRSQSSSVISPFLQTASGKTLAGCFRRSGGADCWVFPGELVEHGAECAAIGVGIWRKQDLVRFPEPVEDWTKQPRWQTVEEVSVTSDLSTLRETRQQVLERLQVDESALEAKLWELGSAADSDERLLLTAQGDELVRAVQRCLGELGFKVEYMDDVWRAGDRREDLRVRLPTDPKWTAIVEVRGYKNGAAVNDLVRLLARFRTRYLQEVGTLPSCSWYIANAFIPEDPAMRPPILHSNDAEVETFGEDDGLAIGTVFLFDMLMDVRRGRLTQEDAQQLLRDGRGRLIYQLSSSG
jgi:hypothetical protein